MASATLNRSFTINTWWLLLVAMVGLLAVGCTGQVKVTGNASNSQSTPVASPTPTGPDLTGPMVELTTTAATQFNSGLLSVSVKLSEPVASFSLSDLNVTNGTAANLSGSGTEFSFTVTPLAEGPVTISLAAGVVQDAAGNSNAAPATLTRAFDATAPTVTLSSVAATETNVSPLSLTVTFSEDVTGFSSSDVIVGNGTITGFSGSGLSYTLNITPTLEGAVTVDVNAGAAQDAAGNGNTSATQLVRTYDTIQPSVSLASSASDPFNASSFNVTATFSEDVTNFVQGDITVGNAAISGFAGGPAIYTFTVTPSGQGTVTVAVNATVAQDAAGNTNTAASSLTRTYDSVGPSVSSFTAQASTLGAYTASLTLSDSVTDLAQGDFSISNGAITAFSGSGANYTIDVTPTATGNVTLTLNAGSVTDAVGNTGPASAASVLTAYAPPVWSQQAYLKAPNAAANHQFGYSVAVSGDTIVVSAFNEDSTQTTITNGATASGVNSLTPTGAAYVFRRSGSTWAQEAYLKPPTIDEYDIFGTSVAISGDTIVVGAMYEDSSQTTITNGASASANNSFVDSGAAYVFRRTGSTWIHEAYLKASNSGSGDWFGTWVAVNDDTIVVGAPHEDSSQTTITNGAGPASDDSAMDTGAAYVFRRSGTYWAQEAYLKASNAKASDALGFSADVSGDTIVVGAQHESSNQTTITNGAGASSDNSTSDAGAAYVFRRNGTTWSQEAYLKAPNANASDFFGWAAAVSGDTIVVGAYGESSAQTTITNGATASADNSASGAGAAYVFRRTGTTWAQEAYLKAPNALADAEFGVAVSISGDRIVVGADGESSAQTTVTNGTTASSDASEPWAGAAYVFRRTGTTWIQESYLKPPNPDTADLFGAAVAVSGTTVVVGALYEDSGATSITNGATASSDDSVGEAGAAYVYHFNAPFATLSSSSGLPTTIIQAGSTSLSLNIGGTGVVSYIYKIGLVGSTDCSSASGYSATFPVSTPLSYDLSTFPENSSVILCVVGVDAAGNRQSYANATTHTWLARDLTAPAAPASVAVDRTSLFHQQTSPVISWPAVSDLGLHGYELAIGTTAGATDVRSWQFVGNVTAYQFTDLNLNVDTVYHVAVRAVDLSRNASTARTGASWTTSCVGSIWCAQAYLKASNAEANDRFGKAVAISGDTVVVGATNEDSSQTTITNGATASADNTAANSGAVYVFRRSGSTWAQEAYLKAANAEAGDNYGYAVAINGDVLVVGANNEDALQTTITNGSTASSLNNAVDSGAVYVYRRSGSTWAQEAYIKAANAEAYDFFGNSVAISGDTIVVGTGGDDSSQTTITNGTTAAADNTITNTGAAYVYRRTGTNWAQEAYLKPPNLRSLLCFGDAVAISGDTIVVGAIGESSNQTTITNGTTASADNSVTGSGAAYVYRRTGTTWAQQAFLKAPNRDPYDYFGKSVAISGDTVVVGAYLESSNQTTITNATTAPTSSGATNSGAAYVFQRSGSTWAQQAYLKASNAHKLDEFGISVAASGDLIVVGAHQEDSSQTTITHGTTTSSDRSAEWSGAAYVFRRTGTTWAQDAYVKALNAEAEDTFGAAVAVSGDTIVVGAWQEDSNQTTITNNPSASSDNSAAQAGAAYVYRHTSGVDAKTVGSAQVYYNPVGGEAVTISVEYSDNSAYWTTAGSTRVAATGSRTYNLAFSPVGSHRYWRLAFSDTSDSCVSGSVAILEAQLYLVNELAVDLASKTVLSSQFTNTSYATDGNTGTSAVRASSCTPVISWDFGP